MITRVESSLEEVLGRIRICGDLENRWRNELRLSEGKAYLIFRKVIEE